MDDPPVNEWERAYNASIEAEHEANLRVEEAHARQMAMMPLQERRRRRRTYVVILLLAALLLVPFMVIEGVASHRVVSGHAVNGTAVLIQRVSIDCGRAPCGYKWEAHFVSDDGTVDRIVEFAEDVPSHLGVAGTRVDARWTSVNPDAVYLAESASFRNWVAGLLFAAGVCLLVAGTAWVVLRKRSRLRKQIELGALASGSTTP